MYLCSETPEKSGERGRPAEGGKVDAERGEGKDEAEAGAEVEAPVVARTTTTTLATREEEMVVLIPEAVEGEGVGAIGVEVDPVEDGVRRMGEEEAGAVAEAMGTTTTAMAAEVVERGDVGAVGVEVEDGLRVTAVGEGGEVGGVQEEAVEGEVVTVLTLL